MTLEQYLNSPSMQSRSVRPRLEAKEDTSKAPEVDLMKDLYEYHSVLGIEKEQEGDQVNSFIASALDDSPVQFTNEEQVA